MPPRIERELLQQCDRLKERLISEHGLRLIRFRWDDLISDKLVRSRLRSAQKSPNSGEKVEESPTEP